MTIKLIAIDLDGTVVDHDLSISPLVIEGLQKAQRDYGCKVIIATGRMFPSTIQFADRIENSNPIISYQGAMIRHKLEEKPMFHQGIDLSTARELISVIQDNNYHTNLYIDDVLYTNFMNEKAWYYKSLTGVTPVHQPDLLEVLTKDPSKIMIIDEDCDAVMANLKSQFDGRIHICISRKDFCEIVHPDISKWVAIEELLKLWNISASEVMAIGDQDNDIAMIEGAGIGVAMGNAPQHIKDRANFVTKSIKDDGVLHALNEFIFV